MCWRGYIGKDIYIDFMCVSKLFVTTENEVQAHLSCIVMSPSPREGLTHYFDNGRQSLTHVGLHPELRHYFVLPSKRRVPRIFSFIFTSIASFRPANTSRDIVFPNVT